MSAPEDAPTRAARDLALARSAQWAAGWMVLGNALAAGVGIFAMSALRPDAVDIPWVRPVLIGLNLALAATGAAMAWRIRKGPARWPIVVLLVWLVLETLGKATGPRPLGAVIDVVFLFVAGRALVAAQALRIARQALPARSVDPGVF